MFCETVNAIAYRALKMSEKLHLSSGDHLSFKISFIYKTY